LNSLVIGASPSGLEDRAIYTEMPLTNSPDVCHAALAEIAEYTQSLSGLEETFVEVPSVRCNWAGCRSFVQIDEEDILQHLVEDHHVVLITGSTERSKIRCLWKNCAKVYRGEISTLVRHIKQEHMEDHSIFCEYCDSSVSFTNYHAHLITNCSGARDIGIV